MSKICVFNAFRENFRFYSIKDTALLKLCRFTVDHPYLLNMLEGAAS